MSTAAVRRWARPVAVTATLAGLVIGGQAGLSGPLRPRAQKAAVAGGYVVKRGDTLSRIASTHGVPMKDLAKANNISNVHVVYLGETLVIPTQQARVAAATTPATAGAGARATISLLNATPAAAIFPVAGSKLPPALLTKPERLALMPSFDRWAATYGVAPDLLKALTWMESGWQNQVVSSVAARGIGQLTPATSKFVSEQLLRTRLDPAVPDDNIRMSARYLSYLLSRTGDERLALSAYYQGLGSLTKNGVLPVSKLYVDDIMALRLRFS